MTYFPASSPVGGSACRSAIALAVVAAIALAVFWFTRPKPIPVVVTEVARGRTPWDEGAPGRSPRGRKALILLALALVGLSGVYYVAFTLILLLSASLLRAGVGRPPQWWKAGLITCLWTAARKIRGPDGLFEDRGR